MQVNELRITTYRLIVSNYWHVLHRFRDTTNSLFGQKLWIFIPYLCLTLS